MGGGGRSDECCCFNEFYCRTYPLDKSSISASSESSLRGGGGKGGVRGGWGGGGERSDECCCFNEFYCRTYPLDKSSISAVSESSLVELLQPPVGPLDPH